MSTLLDPECAVCHAQTAADERFCEACGEPLTPGVIVDERDHREVDAVVVAGVTDRGLVHRRNEDALHVEVHGHHVIAVVCDGVSSSTAPDAASAAAVAAAAAVLTPSQPTTSDDDAAAMRAAIEAAQEAVVDVPWTRTRNRGAPSCTFVGARWDGSEITVGSVGDSRAYWIADTSAILLLTLDDSWAREQVADGNLDEAAAQRHPHAHAITRWLGEDAPAGTVPITSFTPPTPGRLVLCSDGLWNYTPTIERLAALVRASGPDAPPIAVARALTQFALASGGRDNVTVVVVDITPAVHHPEED